MNVKRPILPLVLIALLLTACSAATSQPQALTPPPAASPIPLTPATAPANLAAASPTAGPASRPNAAAPSPTGVEANSAPVASGVEVPPGFQARIYFDGLNSPTSLAFGPDGRLYVAQQNGRVVSLGDQGGRGTDMRQVSSAGGVTLGIAFRPGTHDLYISTTGRILVAHAAEDGSFGEPKAIVSGIPTGRHQNDSIAFAADGKYFFLGVGSTCDACRESDPRSASILRISADGSDVQVYAHGTRNPYGLAFFAQTGELFATDNGRDNPVVGVPDELNVIVQDGNYGWPDCWGRGQGSNCQGTLPPVALFQEHSSADGIAFYDGANFPAEYRGDAFVALWGGNLPVPTVGKRVDRVKLSRVGGEWQGQVSAFASGLDHPLAVAVGPRDGALYIADHGSGRIYRVLYVGS